MFGMRRKAGFAVITTAALALLAAAVPAASSAGCGGGGGVTASGGCADGSYVNPFKKRAWLPGRTDMGVDWAVTKPKGVIAIGDAKILGAEKNTGWPGGHFMWYRLLDGDHAGSIIYVAEYLSHMLPAGTTVSAGDKIAVALKGGTGTEWGWAKKNGQPRAAPCYHEGMKTNSGKQMARFIRSLGATTADDPGPGPDWPSGKRC